jgi:hypothetical protein
MGPNSTQYPQMVARDIPQEEIPPLKEDVQEGEEPEEEQTDKEDSQEDDN